MAKSRSPSYPIIDLREAVEAVTKIYEQEHTNPMNRETAVVAMGYKSLSGAAARKLAALSRYGLLAGRDEDIAVSNDAVIVIADANIEDGSERVAALKRCLYASELFSDLAKRYSGSTPSEANIASYLIKEGFKPDAARKAASVYKSSVAFVERASKNCTEADSPDSEDEIGGTDIKVGDYIQWESQGVLQFQSKKVTSLTDDGEYVYVEGSNTALPIQEVNVIDPPSNGSHDEKPPVNPPMIRKPGGMRQETFALDIGDVTIQWPSKMNKESFEDFSDWLDILKRKVARTIEKPDDGENE